MRNAIISFLLISALISAGCSAGNQSAKKSQNAAEDHVLSASDTSQVEILKVSPPSASCFNEQSAIEIEYVIKTKEFDNVVKFQLLDEGGTAVATASPSRPTGDAKVSFEFVSLKESNNQYTLTAEFRGKKVYEKKLSIPTKNLELGQELEVIPLYTKEGLSEPVRMLIKHNVAAMAPCKKIPKSGSGFEVYDKNGKLIFETKIPVTTESMTVSTCKGEVNVQDKESLKTNCYMVGKSPYEIGKLGIMRDDKDPNGDFYVGSSKGQYASFPFNSRMLLKENGPIKIKAYVDGQDVIRDDMKFKRQEMEKTVELA